MKNTTLYVLGGVAVVAAAGAAIYFATKKPALPSAGGGAAGTTPGGSTTTPNSNTNKPGPTYQANALPLELQTFANWLAQNSKLIDPNTLQNV